MAKLVVIYKKPADPAAFDAYYFGTHVPLAKKIPGIVRFDTNDGAMMSPTGPSPYHLIATLEFESLGSLQQGMGSPEGRAAAADVPNFATAGSVEMLIFATKEV